MLDKSNMKSIKRLCEELKNWLANSFHLEAEPDTMILENTLQTN